MADITLEQVEKLRSRSNLSYEEARTLLEECGGSVLDALIRLEAQGRATSSAGAQPPQWPHPPLPEEPPKKSPIKVITVTGSDWENFWKDARTLLGRLWEILRHCNLYRLRIFQRGKVVSALPIWVAAVLLLVAPYVAIPLLVVGLALGCRFDVSKED